MMLLSPFFPPADLKGRLGHFLRFVEWKRLRIIPPKIRESSSFFIMRSANRPFYEAARQLVDSSFLMLGIDSRFFHVD